MSMCFTLPWSLVFLVSAIAPRLSPRSRLGIENLTFISLNQLCIQTICCAHRDIATYSASTVDRATVVCRLLLQVTGPPAMIKTYPEVDRRVSRHPPLLASTYA